MLHDDDASQKSHVRRMQLRLAEDLLLPKAKSHELWAIQNLLLISAQAIRDEHPLSKGIADYIASAFEAIHGGENADDAFGIKRKRGEKDLRASRGRAFWMAHCLARLKHSGMTVERALDEVANRFCVSPDTAKAVWKKNRIEALRITKIERERFGIEKVVWPE